MRLFYALYSLADTLKEKSFQKLSISSLQIMFSIQIDQELTPPSKTLTRLWRMPRKPQKSNLTGLKGGGAKVQHCTVLVT